MNLSVVEYTTDRAAEVLGIHEAQVRILAQQNGISAPFSGDELEVLRDSLDRDTAPDTAIATTAGDEFSAPINPTGENIEDAIALHLEQRIISRAVQKLSSRWGHIEDQILSELAGLKQ